MRTLNTAGQALLDRLVAGEKIPVVDLLYMGLPVPQRWALAGVPLVWGGNTWQARDIAISELADEVPSINNLRITLPGVTESERALALDGDIEGAAVELYKALVDPDTGAVGDALLVWAGELDMPGWQYGREAAVHFSAEHRATIALRPRVSRYTNDEQQRLYAGDTSLDIDPATDGGDLIWPAAGFYKR